MTIQTAVLIETLVSLGAEVRGRRATSSPPRTTPPPRRSSARTDVEEPKGVPVFAWKGESLEDYWWAASQMLTWPGGAGEHDPRRWRDAPCWCCVARSTRSRASFLPPTEDDDSDEWKVFLALVRCALREPDKTKWTKIAESVQGVTEETTTGVLRSTSSPLPRELAFPRSTSNDFGDQEQVPTTSTHPALR